MNKYFQMCLHVAHITNLQQTTLKTSRQKYKQKDQDALDCSPDLI